jgi:hypothetical protein
MTFFRDAISAHSCDLFMPSLFPNLRPESLQTDLNEKQKIKLMQVKTGVRASK